MDVFFFFFDTFGRDGMLSSAEVQMTTQKGTISYMAPEICSSNAYGPEGSVVITSLASENLRS